MKNNIPEASCSIRLIDAYGIIKSHAEFHSGNPDMERGIWSAYFHLKACVDNGNVPISVVKENLTTAKYSMRTTEEMEFLAIFGRDPEGNELEDFINGIPPGTSNV